MKHRSDLPLRPPGNVIYHKVVNSLIGVTSRLRHGVYRMPTRRPIKSNLLLRIVFDQPNNDREISYKSLDSTMGPKKENP